MVSLDIDETMVYLNYAIVTLPPTQKVHQSYNYVTGYEDHRMHCMHGTGSRLGVLVSPITLFVAQRKQLLSL